MIATRTCLTCTALVDSAPGGGRRYYCAACHDNGRRQRDRHLHSRYGVFGLLAFEALLKAQDGRCANPLCGNEPTDTDHDHACCPGAMTCGKCVRWLLCSSCNLAEGHIKTARRARGLYLLMDRGL